MDIVKSHFNHNNLSSNSPLTINISFLLFGLQIQSITMPCPHHCGVTKKLLGQYKTTEFVKVPSSNGKHLVILSYATPWYVALFGSSIYIFIQQRTCMAVFPLCRTIMSCRKLLREDFSMELRRKGIFKYLPMLLNDSHPPESGGWISGYETCCGFLQLIHMNLYFISFIHLIFLCTYLHAHTLNSHAANFLFSLLLPLSPSGATTKEHTRLCTKTPI